jgi:hypothetical protein
MASRGGYQKSHQRQQLNFRARGSSKAHRTRAGEGAPPTLPPPPPTQAVDLGVFWGAADDVALEAAPGVIHVPHAVFVFRTRGSSDDSGDDDGVLPRGLGAVTATASTAARRHSARLEVRGQRIFVRVKLASRSLTPEPFLLLLTVTLLCGGRVLAAVTRGVRWEPRVCVPRVVACKWCGPGAAAASEDADGDGGAAEGCTCGGGGAGGGGGGGGRSSTGGGGGVRRKIERQTKKNAWLERGHWDRPDARIRRIAARGERAEMREKLGERGDA